MNGSLAIVYTRLISIIFAVSSFYEWGHIIPTIYIIFIAGCLRLNSQVVSSNGVHSSPFVPGHAPSDKFRKKPTKTGVFDYRHGRTNEFRDLDDLVKLLRFRLPSSNVLETLGNTWNRQNSSTCTRT